MFECAHWRINADYLVVVHHEISNYCVVGETGDVSVASKTSMVSTCGTIYVYTTRGQRQRDLRVRTRDVINATSLQRDTEVSIFLSALWRTDGYPSIFT